MQAHIFAAASTTTAEERDQYDEGLVEQIAGPYEALAELAATHLLSAEYGVASGKGKRSSVSPGEQKPDGSDGMAEQARTELDDATAKADVLLSTDGFQQRAAEVWDELAAAATPESIRWLGAARRSLEGLACDELGAKNCPVPTDQRVGVARIGAETRADRLEAVKQTAAR